MNELEMNLATSAASQMVPAGFAEKAMASLMQLHGELVAEKERRVELYRTLMEKEQSLAELAMYVRVLEERLGQLQPPSGSTSAAGRPQASKSDAAAGANASASPAAAVKAPATAQVPPRPIQVGAQAVKKADAQLKVPPPAPRASAQAEGWKVW